MTDLSIETPSAPIIGKQPRPIYSNSGWTDERIEFLKRMWGDGLSASQIAWELGGVTRNSVIGKVHRLGLSGRIKKTPASSTPHFRKPRSYVSREAMRAERITHQQEEVVEEEPEVVVIDEVIPIGQRRTVLELTDQTCKWPVGNPGEPSFFFCGGQTVTSLPYCGFHCRVSYQPANLRRDRARKPHRHQPERQQQEAA